MKQREIKFRVWDGERMWTPWRVIHDNKGGWQAVADGRQDSIASTDPGVALLEFTGLYDADGKEIYEGDIIGEDVDYSLVEHKDFGHTACDWYGWGLQGPNGHKDCVPFHPDEDMKVEMFVIGNIYEHPHLVKR